MEERDLDRLGVVTFPQFAAAYADIFGRDIEPESAPSKISFWSVSHY